jgi:hypothetical protein
MGGCMSRVLNQMFGVTIALSVFGFFSVVSAQNLPVLNPEYTRQITQEVSGDAAYEHIRFQTQFHRPRGGSDGLWRVAEYMEQTAREVGLTDVQLIKQAYATPPWNARFADLWITEPEPERIASTIQSVLHLADYSRPTDVTGELVDIGAGTPADYDGVDVSGRVVMTYGDLGAVMREFVGNRGALGVLWYPSPFSPMSGRSGAGLYRPDQLRWIRVSPSQDSDGYEPTFAFGISARQGVRLSHMLAAADEPVMVQAVVDASFESQQGTEPWQVMVEGYIRGTEPGLGQDVVLTSHLQEEAQSANDDASGAGSMLEIGRALNRLIEEGRIPRPKRNIRFWWVTEISSQRQYFADHPEAHNEMWVNINQDMVGANQAQDVMRKQNITRVPAARFHFFNDVVESVIEYMVTVNKFELAQFQAGTPFYPEPHMAHLGSRHRYNAEMIFFHGSSDHMTFNEAPIGVPGTSFTNMPDRFIHSSDDDLWNVDRTQLGRNAAAVALMAYIMGSADGAMAPTLAAQTVGRGMERLGRNLRLAQTWIANSEDKETAYQNAVDQMWYAAERERLAISSLVEIDPSLENSVAGLLEALARREEQGMRDVQLAYRQVTGQRRVPRKQESETESRLADLQPSIIAGPIEFLTGRGRISGVRGLHGLMAHELLNAVNGERSGLDVYRFVAAEAREAGAHYYGVVAAEAVLQYLESAAEVGLITLR